MNLVKNQVMESVGGIAGIPEDKKNAAVETTAHSLVDGLKQYATADNLSGLTSLLGIGGASSGSSGMANSLTKSIVSALTSKVGLNPAMSQTIASTVIPAVMSLFRKKVEDDNEPGFNLGSLVGSLAGKSGGSSSVGGLMDLVGSFLGKK